MSDKIYWPLCADVFTIWDKIKISWFLFTERIWTYGKWVKKYENMWEKEFGCKHAIMVSSGSTANELIALRRKWELQETGEWPKRKKVICPVNTWISSVSPFIYSGYEIVFSDVTRGNFNISADILREILNKDIDKEIGTVFYTALLGFHQDLIKCKELTEAHGARFLMDNCEASFSRFVKFENGQNKFNSILNLVTCSTSIFYSHFTTSGTEGGLIFTQDDEEANWYRMMRSHGLTRGMPEKYKNPNVNQEFDFALIGTNYRSSNLQAYMASLDFGRAVKFSGMRCLLMLEFIRRISSSYRSLFSLDDLAGGLTVPLAIPITCRSQDHRREVEKYLKDSGVVTRPIIGGCLLAHTAFKRYGDINDFPIAKELHECGLYVGLNKNVTSDMVKKLAEDLNKI